MCIRLYILTTHYYLFDMRITARRILLFCSLYLLRYSAAAQGCVNADFSDGNYSGWTGTYTEGQCSQTGSNGKCRCSPTDPAHSAGFNQGPNDNPVNDATNEYNQIITTTAGGNDPNLAARGFNMPTVYPGNAYSARIGNMWQEVSNTKLGDGESISYSFLVTAANCNFTYHYAVVLYSGNHTAGQQAYFHISMTAGGTAVACAEYQVDATTAATIGGFSSSNDSVYWKPWSSVAVPLYDYIGQTVNITFTTRGCIPNGCAGKHYAYAYIAAECSPLALNIGSTLTCGQNDTLTAPQGFATYSWSGPGIIGSHTGQRVVVTQGGRYVVAMTTFGDAPCGFTMDTLIAGTNPQPYFSFPTICVGDSFPFHDLSTATGTISSWHWNFGDGRTSAAQSPWHTYTAAGTYPVTLSITAGPCTRDTTIDVTVVPPPTGTFTVQSPVCIYTLSHVVYTGNAPATYTYDWDFDGGGGGAASQGPFNISWLNSGTKTIILQVTTGYCTSVPDTEPVVVKPFLGMQLSAATTICQGQTATLTADNCTTYQWSPGATLNDSTTATVYATPISTTTYSVTGTTIECVSVDTVTVFVKKYASATFTAGGPVCIGQNSTVIYTGDGGDSAIYRWDFHGGTAVPDTGEGPLLVYWLTPGDHSITLDIDLAGCDTAVTDTVSVFSQPPHPALTADTVLGCPGLDVCFTSAPVGDNIGYSWSFGDGDTSHAQNPCYVYPQAGVYTVSFQVALSPECVYDTTMSHLVTVLPLAHAAFTPSPPVIQQPDSLIIFTNESKGAAGYLWDFYGAYSTDHITGISTETNPTFDYSTYGVFRVTLYAYNLLGCPDSVSRSVTVWPEQNFYIPNAFTPNGDGINDEFYVYAQPGANVVSFQVYDRWGEKVHDGIYPWDGTYRGQPLEPGIYAYIATIQLIDQTQAVQNKGSVTLIR
jgi:gliding motility-associated-like protein